MPEMTGASRLPTGDRALDRVLSGGLPAGGLVVLSGPVGSGKSLLAHRVCRAVGEDAVYFLALKGSPEAVARRHAEPRPRYVDLGPRLLESEADEVLGLIEAELGGTIRLVVIDDLDGLTAGADEPRLRATLERLDRALANAGACGLLVATEEALPPGGWLAMAAHRAAMVIALEEDDPPRRWRLRVLKHEGAPAAEAQPYRLGPEGPVFDRVAADVATESLGGGLGARMLATFRTTRRAAAADIATLLGMEIDVVTAALDGLVASGQLVTEPGDDGRPIYALPAGR